MGCDIHCYVEYKRPGYDRWSGFSGRINPGRNYGLFARMAGVRNYDGIAPMVEPRGYPNDASFDADDDAWLYVTETPGEGCCTRERAEYYVTSHNCRWKDDDKKWVSHPDWHSHSWLTTDEFAAALTHDNDRGYSQEYRAVLAAMRSLEADGCKVRLVFWFDN